MQTFEALRVAVDIVQAPSRVPFVRSSALPPGIQDVLQIAAGDDEVIAMAAHETGRTRERVVEAATFFIEQAMLYPEADSYRILGGTEHAPVSELRRNMALLMRWLHPDTSRGAERGVFATRIARAWDDIKTDDRRAAYDQRLRSARQASLDAKREHKGPRRFRPLPSDLRAGGHRPPRRPGVMVRLLRFIFASRDRDAGP